MEYKLKGMPGMPQVPSALPKILMIAGGALAFLGLFVIYNPALLPYMVGGVFLLIGALLALIGYRARRLVG